MEWKSGNDVNTVLTYKILKKEKLKVNIKKRNEVEVLWEHILLLSQ